MAKTTKKVLVVEDEQDLRDFYKEVLENADFYVEVAKDGQEGLQKIIEGDFDVVLLDIMMPKIDGLGILQILKEQKQKKNLPKIIMLTNLSHDKTLEEAKNLGAVGWIIKSDTNPQELIKKISTC